MARTLIDGLWLFGGNRERGIGAYLDYYFREVCQIPVEDRYWLVPQNAPDWQVNVLLTRYGGQSIELDTEMSGQRQRELLERWLDDKEILMAFIASPFERPRSMLDFVRLFQQKEIYTEAIVFDLLPLQFRKQILDTWPEEDQEEYERRLVRLQQVNHLWAISPQTRQAVITLLDYPAEHIEVLRFGLGTKWIQEPEGIVAESLRGQDRSRKTKRTTKQTRVLTISAGEWRKNLDGTIRYFAQEWKGKPAVLSIICELGVRQWLRLVWLAIRLGIWKQIRFLGKASEEIKWQELYRADVFLFLSRGEGLGIPLLEAKKAKIPRIILSKELADVGFGSLVEAFEVAENRSL